MRTLEMLLAASCAAAIIVLIIRKGSNRKAAAAAGIACGALFVAHLLFEGYRWQMIPAYVVAALLVVIASSRRSKRWRPLQYTIMAIFVVLLGGSVALSSLLPVIQLPKPTGEFRVGTKTFHFVDSSREDTFTEQKDDKRELMVQVWYPAAKSGGSDEKSTIFPRDKKLFRTYMEAYSGQLGLPAVALDYWKYSRAHSYADAELLPADRPYPVVLLSHGMGTGRLLHTSQAENLASHGFIVFAIDHTYSTFATAFPDGRVTGFLTEPSQTRFYEDSRSILQVWNKDISFVVDQLEKLNSGVIASPFEGMLDMDNLGVMGHSFGGAAAFEAVYSNPRIKAGVDMDGTLLVTRGRDDINKPFLFIESEEFVRVNREQAKYRTTPITDEELKSLRFTREQFETILANRELELKLIDRVAQQGGGKAISIEGTGHFNFTDLPLYSPLLSKTGMTGSIDGARGAELVNRYVLEFFNQSLRGIKSKLLEGPRKDDPEVKDLESMSLGE